MEDSHKQLDIAWETPSEYILSSLQLMGRNDLEEYFRENNFIIDPSIETLFKDNENSPLSFDSNLLEKAKKHPNLFIAPQIELQQAGQNNALGLFAGETILKNQPIMEYVGQAKIVFILVAEEPALLGWFPQNLTREEAGLSHYNFGFPEQYISKELWQRAKTFAPSPDEFVAVNVCIDPAKSGNAARFANHSIKWANTELVVVAENIDGKLYLHPLLVALRDIKQGEEILWNYGKNNDYIELKGNELSPEYASRELNKFLIALNFETKENNDRRYKELHAAPYFHDNLSSEDAKKLLVEPASYLLRQEDGRFFFCANGQDFRLDENYEPINSTEYLEIEFFIIDGLFTFYPDSDPERYGNHVGRLYELRKAAKWILFDRHLEINKKKAVRKLKI